MTPRFLTSEKSISLFYTAGGSDKVYEAGIEDVGAGFAVNFRFGRRGSNLAAGTKTRQPVPLEDAEKIFARLIAEKRAKGYTEDAGGKPFGGDADKLADVLPHPRKEIVSLITMRNFSGADFLRQRKYDGELSKLPIGGAVVLAEFMRKPISGHHYTAADREMFARWPGGWWAALTVAEWQGENVLNESTALRWSHLQGLQRAFTPDILLADVVSDVQAVMDAGAEGVCAHAWESPWGEMFCHKVSGIYICRVTSTGATQSVGICDDASGQPRGNVKMGGGKCDQVRVGSIIRVEAMGETDAGKLRQPVPCREWLVRY